MWQSEVAPRVSEEAKPYRALMAAVIRQAIMDSDREWLETEQCETYCVALGVDQKAAIGARSGRQKKGRP